MTDPNTHGERLRYDRRSRRRRRFGWGLIALGSIVMLVVGYASVWMVNRQWHGIYVSSGPGVVQWQLANGALMVHAFELTPEPEPGTAHFSTAVFRRSVPRYTGLFQGWHWAPRAGLAPKATGGGPAVRLPVWVPGLIAAVMIGTGLRLIRAVDSSRCARCRYLLTGLSPQTTRCPECGHPLPPRDHAVNAEAQHPSLPPPPSAAADERRAAPGGDGCAGGEGRDGGGGA